MTHPSQPLPASVIAATDQLLTEQDRHIDNMLKDWRRNAAKLGDTRAFGEALTITSKAVDNPSVAAMIVALLRRLANAEAEPNQ